MANNLIRRGAVYRWRRRIPLWAFPIVGRSHICLSLGTADPVEARRRAIELTYLSETWFQNMAKAKNRPPLDTRDGAWSDASFERFLKVARSVIDEADRERLRTARPIDTTIPDDLPASDAIDWRTLAPPTSRKRILSTFWDSVRRHPTGRTAIPPERIGLTPVGQRGPDDTTRRFPEITVVSKALLNWIEARAFVEAREALEATDDLPDSEHGNPEFDRVQALREGLIAGFKRARKAGRPDIAESLLQDILAASGLHADPKRPVWKPLSQRVLAGMERALHHHADPFAVQPLPDPGPPPVPGAVSPVDPPPETVVATPKRIFKTRHAVRIENGRAVDRIAKPDDTFSVAIAAYKASAIQRLRDPKSLRDLELAARLFTETVGDLALAEITSEDVEFFREIISKLPAAHGRGIYAGLGFDRAVDLREDLEEAIKEEDHETVRRIVGRSTMSPNALVEPIRFKTIKKHLSSLQSFYKQVMRAHRHAFDRNPFHEMLIPSALVAKDRAFERREWTVDDLTKLFSSDVWAGWHGNLDRAKPDWRRDARTWVPLLGALAFLRLEEALRLKPSNIVMVDGLPCIDLVRAPDQPLKSDAAVRTVPMHPILVDLGLPELAADQKRRGHHWLFEDLPTPIHGRMSHKFSQEFTALRRSIGIYERGLDFHAFRTTAGSVLRRAGVSLTFREGLLGHEPTNKITDAVYAKGHFVRALATELAKFDPADAIRQALVPSDRRSSRTRGGHLRIVGGS